LTADELSAAAEILRTGGQGNTNQLFVSIALHEPEKEVVGAWESGEGIPRRAFAVVDDRRANLTFEALVDLDAKVVVSWTAIPSVQPMVTETEDLEAMKLVRENPVWREAMSRREITDFGTVLLTPWAQGHFPLPGPKGGRFYRVLSYQRGNQTNAYVPLEPGGMTPAHATVLDVAMWPLRTTRGPDPRCRGGSSCSSGRVTHCGVTGITRPEPKGAVPVN
jgi:primary-amine oxidase